jgi:DNA-binding FrmR family transcriptional regulator
MPKVTFVFDKEKDIWNVWSTANSKSKLFDFAKKLPQKVAEAAKGKSLEECREEIQKEYMDVYNSEILKIFINALNEAWQTIEKEYFSRIRKITGRDLSADRITGYVTTSPRCPYNEKENTFFCQFFSSLPSALQTAGHEIMHLHFHEHYMSKVENEVGKQKAQDLKEALSVLLNFEFKDLWSVEDRGYEIHKALRTFISTEWKKSHDFDLLLKNCIDYVKKN